MNITLLQGQINGLLSIYDKSLTQNAPEKPAQTNTLFSDLDDDLTAPQKKSKKPSTPKIRTIIEEMALVALNNDNERKSLLGYLSSSDFYDAPASTIFHGSFSGGLASHTLCVIMESLRLAPAIFREWAATPAYSDKIVITASDIFISALCHDLCKVNFYSSELRNRKDSKGRWEQYKHYIVKPDNRNLGHGGESCLQLIKLCPSYIDNRLVLEAIKAHMGFSDLSPTEAKNYNNLLDNPLVLLLQIADQIASFWSRS